MWGCACSGACLSGTWALELALGCCKLRSFLKYARRGLARLATMDAAEWVLGKPNAFNAAEQLEHYRAQIVNMVHACLGGRAAL